MEGTTLILAIDLWPFHHTVGYLLGCADLFFKESAWVGKVSGYRHRFSEDTHPVVRNVCLGMARHSMSRT
jgi:hypothetical protein